MDLDDAKYDKKLSDLKKYLPLLNNMEERLKSTYGEGLGIQLPKIQGLKSLLLSNKRMKMDNLLKCEQVLVKLYNKTQEKISSQYFVPIAESPSAAEKICEPTSDVNKFVEKEIVYKPPSLNFYTEHTESSDTNKKDSISNETQKINKLVEKDISAPNDSKSKYGRQFENAGNSENILKSPIPKQAVVEKTDSAKINDCINSKKKDVDMRRLNIPALTKQSPDTFSTGSTDVDMRVRNYSPLDTRPLPNNSTPTTGFSPSLEKPSTKNVHRYDLFSTSSQSNKDSNIYNITNAKKFGNTSTPGTQPAPQTSVFCSSNFDKNKTSPVHKGKNIDHKSGSKGEDLVHLESVRAKLKGVFSMDKIDDTAQMSNVSKLFGKEIELVTQAYIRDGDILKISKNKDNSERKQSEKTPNKKYRDSPDTSNRRYTRVLISPVRYPGTKNQSDLFARRRPNSRSLSPKKRRSKSKSYSPKVRRRRSRSLTSKDRRRRSRSRNEKTSRSRFNRQSPSCESNSSFYNYKKGDHSRVSDKYREDSGSKRDSEKKRDDRRASDRYRDNSANRVDKKYRGGDQRTSAFTKNKSSPEKSNRSKKESDKKQIQLLGARIEEIIELTELKKKREILVQQLQQENLFDALIDGSEELGAEDTKQIGRDREDGEIGDSDYELDIIYDDLDTSKRSTNSSRKIPKNTSENLRIDRKSQSNKIDVPKHSENFKISCEKNKIFSLTNNEKTQNSSPNLINSKIGLETGNSNKEYSRFKEATGDMKSKNSQANLNLLKKMANIITSEVSTINKSKKETSKKVDLSDAAKSETGLKLTKSFSESQKASIAISKKDDSESIKKKSSLDEDILKALADDTGTDVEADFIKKFRSSTKNDSPDHKKTVDNINMSDANKSRRISLERYKEKHSALNFKNEDEIISDDTLKKYEAIVHRVFTQKEIERLNPVITMTTEVASTINESDFHNRILKPKTGVFRSESINSIAPEESNKGLQMFSPPSDLKNQSITPSLDTKQTSVPTMDTNNLPPWVTPVYRAQDTIYPNNNVYSAALNLFSNNFFGLGAGNVTNSQQMNIPSQQESSNAFSCERTNFIPTQNTLVSGHPPASFRQCNENLHNESQNMLNSPLYSRDSANNNFGPRQSTQDFGNNSFRKVINETHILPPFTPNPAIMASTPMRKEQSEEAWVRSDPRTLNKTPVQQNKNIYFGQGEINVPRTPLLDTPGSCTPRYESQTPLLDTPASCTPNYENPQWRSDNIAENVWLSAISRNNSTYDLNWKAEQEKSIYRNQSGSCTPVHEPSFYKPNFSESFGSHTPIHEPNYWQGKSEFCARMPLRPDFSGPQISTFETKPLQMNQREASLGPTARGRTPISNTDAWRSSFQELSATRSMSNEMNIPGSPICGSDSWTRTGTHSSMFDSRCAGRAMQTNTWQPLQREPSMTHRESINRESNIGPLMRREPSDGRTFYQDSNFQLRNREPSINKSLMGINFDRFRRDSSVGKSINRETSFQRSRSVGRTGFDKSFQNNNIERQFERKQDFSRARSMGRSSNTNDIEDSRDRFARARSLGRSEHREPSVPRFQRNKFSTSSTSEDQKYIRTNNDLNKKTEEYLSNANSKDPRIRRHLDTKNESKRNLENSSPKSNNAEKSRGNSRNHEKAKHNDSRLERSKSNATIYNEQPKHRDERHSRDSRDRKNDSKYKDSERKDSYRSSSFSKSKILNYKIPKLKKDECENPEEVKKSKENISNKPNQASMIEKDIKSSHKSNDDKSKDKIKIDSNYDMSTRKNGQKNKIDTDKSEDTSKKLDTFVNIQNREKSNEDKYIKHSESTSNKNHDCTEDEKINESYSQITVTHEIEDNNENQVATELAKSYHINEIDSESRIVTETEESSKREQSSKRNNKKVISHEETESKDKQIILNSSIKSSDTLVDVSLKNKIPERNSKYNLRSSECKKLSLESPITSKKESTINVVDRRCSLKKDEADKTDDSTKFVELVSSTGITGTIVLNDEKVPVEIVTENTTKHSCEDENITRLVSDSIEEKLIVDKNVEEKHTQIENKSESASYVITDSTGISSTSENEEHEEVDNVNICILTNNTPTDTICSKQSVNVSLVSSNINVYKDTTNEATAVQKSNDILQDTKIQNTQSESLIVLTENKTCYKTDPFDDIVPDSTCSTKSVSEKSSSHKGTSELSNLVEILKNKNKMLEMLAYINQPGKEISDKVKRRLEKLAELDSDDDDNNDLEMNNTFSSCKSKLECEEFIEKSRSDEKKIDAVQKNDTYHEETYESRDSATENHSGIQTENKTSDSVKESHTSGKDISSNDKSEQLENSPENSSKLNVSTENSKTKKKYTKGKRELEMLHEYNLGMFISEDVLHATGVRSCTLQNYENQTTSDIKNIHRRPLSRTAKSIALKEVQASPTSNSTKKKLSMKKMVLSANNIAKTPCVLVEKAKVDDKQLTKKISDIYEYDEDFNVFEDYELTKQKPCPRSKKILPSTLKEPSQTSNTLDSLSINPDLKDINALNQDSEIIPNCGLVETENILLKNIASKLSKNKNNANSASKPMKKKKRSVWKTGVIRKKIKKNKDNIDPNLESKNENVRKIKYTNKSYNFSPNVSQYNCKLCYKYKGLDIVKHYKLHHPHSEVFISRLHPEQARIAIEEAKNPLEDKTSSKKLRQYRCRFCMKLFKVRNLRSVFDHITQQHTGEYKCECSLCAKNKIFRCISICNKSSTLPPATDLLTGVKGYMCGVCNYTQVSHENLKTHIWLRHFNEECELLEINLTQSNARRRRSNGCLELPNSEEIDDSKVLTRSQKCLSFVKSNENDSNSKNKETNTKPKIPEKTIDEEVAKPSCTSTSPIVDISYVSTNNVFLASIPKTPPSIMESSSQNNITDNVFSASIQKNATELSLDASIFQADSDMYKEAEIQIKQESTSPLKDVHFNDISDTNISPTVIKNECLSLVNENEFDLENDSTIVQVGGISRQYKNNETNYLCSIGTVNKCHFTSSYFLVLLRHIESVHTQEYWNGFCKICEKNVAFGMHINYEEALNHLVKSHINDETNLGKIEPTSSPVKNVSIIDKTPLKRTLNETSSLTFSIKEEIHESQPDSLDTVEQIAQQTSNISENELLTFQSQRNSDIVEKVSDIPLHSPSKENDNSQHNMSTSFPKIQLRPITDLMASNNNVNNVDNDPGNNSGVCQLRIENVVSLNPNITSRPSLETQGSEIITNVTTNSKQRPILLHFSPSNPSNKQGEKVIISRTNAMKVTLPLETVSPINKSEVTTFIGREGIHLFKCASNNCNFSVSDKYPKEYIDHVKKHSNNCSNKSWAKCPYCNLSSEDINKLANHLIKEHGACRYQCSLCEYRAAAPLLVVTHGLAAHRVKILHVAEVKSHPDAGDDALIRGLKPKSLCVKPYICSKVSSGKECGKSFFAVDRFVAHLVKHSGLHLCQECGVPLSPTCLVDHLRIIHKYKLLTCPYCTITFDSQTEALGHLAINHSSRRPLLYLRISAEKTNRGCQEDKVILLNLDKIEFYKNSNQSKDSLTASKPAHHQLDLTAFEFQTIASTEKEALEKAKKSSDTSEDTNNIDTSENTNNIPSNSTMALVVQNGNTATLNDNTNNKSWVPSLIPMSPKRVPAVINAVPSISTTRSIKDIKNSKLNSNTPKTTYNPIDDLAEIRRIKTPNSNIKHSSSNTVEQDPLAEIIDATLCAESKSTTDKESDLIITLSDDEDNVPLAFTKTNDEQEKSKMLLKQNVSSNNRIENQVVHSDKEKTCDSESIEILLTDDEASNSSSFKTNLEVLSNDRQPKLKIGCFSTASEQDLKDFLKSTGFVGKQLFRCGNEGCTYSGFTSSEFKDHIRICENAKEMDKLSCFHCKKKFRQNGSLLEHVRSHGSHRYQCNVCFYCGYSAQIIIGHMRKLHKVTNTSVVPINPFKNNSDSDFFIIKTLDTPVLKHKKPGPKSKMHPPQSPSPQQDKVSKKTIFGPDDINSLPLNPILPEEISCKECSFRTKVRSNMLRHLQMHLNEIPVPSVAPINPVPHLETNELHFDKMTNLALSSNIDKPVISKNIEKKDKLERSNSYIEQTSVPKYVPEKERFVCGSTSCSYISVDEIMLRQHWETLHKEETVFHCTHCGEGITEGNRAVSTGVIAVHFRLHEKDLYGCEHCNFMHPKYRCVERHSMETHGRISFRFLREIPQGEDIGEMDIKSWQCSQCPLRATFKAEIVEHCKSLHNIRNPYKCSLCPFSATRAGFPAHFESKHAGRNPKIVCVYFKGDGKEKIVGETDPIWWNQRKRASLFSEENNITTVISETVPDKLPPNKKMRNSTDNIPQDVVEKRVTSPIPDPTKTNPSTQMLPEFGMPHEDKYLCPFCQKFLTSRVSDMKIHLYEELDYRKWACTICGYKSFSSPRILEHSTGAHGVSRTSLLPSDQVKEQWVGNCISTQEKLIRAFKDQKIENKAKASNVENSNNDEDDDKLVISLTEEVASPPAKANVTPAAKIKCPYCDFASVSGIKIHIMRHWKVKPLNCGYCDHSSVRTIELRAHHKRQHPDLQYNAIKNKLPDFPEIVPVERKRTYNKKNASEVSAPKKSKPNPVNSSALPSASGSPKKTKINSMLKSHMCLKCEVSINEDEIKQHETDCEGAQVLIKQTIVCKCSVCMQLTPDVYTVTSHFEQEHSGLELNYVMHKLGAPKIKRFIPNKQMPSFVSGKGSDKYVCNYCSSRFETYINFITHHNTTHRGELIRFTPLTLELIDEIGELKSNVPCGDLECSVVGCNFVASSVKSLLFHIRSHYLTYNCHFCSAYFASYNSYLSHKVLHPGMTIKPQESFASSTILQDRLVKLLKKLRCKYASLQWDESSFINKDEEESQDIVIELNSSPSSGCLSVPDSPSSRPNILKVRKSQVARKSTTTLFIHRKNDETISLSTDDEDTNTPVQLQEYSFYGKKPNKVDLRKINVEMNFLGTRRKITVEKLSTIENLHPELIIEDVTK